MIRRGDVVLIDFPYSDRTGSKIRPALVVQDDPWNRALDDVVLAGITSSQRRQVGSPTQFLIEIATPAGQRSGLRMGSIVEGTALVTLDQKDVLKTLGSLPPTATATVDACLKAALGLT